MCLHFEQGLPKLPVQQETLLDIATTDAEHIKPALAVFTKIYCPLNSTSCTIDSQEFVLDESAIDNRGISDLIYLDLRSNLYLEIHVAISKCVFSRDDERSIRPCFIDISTIQRRSKASNPYPRKINRRRFFLGEKAPPKRDQTK